ncbi:MAG: hypothetical protein JWM72_2638 [Actinomycetia bacterium]|jgi:hypothetical protein|nr:hypothetical protein [Actinomycetes bacterium]
MAVIECPHCGEHVQVYTPEIVRAGHNVSSGEPRWWVMREGADEIHRCCERASAVSR